MEWICYSCGKRCSSPLDERYTVLTDRFMDPTPGNCKDCHDDYILQKRANVVILATGVSIDVAYSIAKAERTYFVKTGIEVDSIPLMNQVKNYTVIASEHYALALLEMRLDSKKVEFNKVDEDYSASRAAIKSYENEPSKFFGKSKRNYRK